MNNYLIAPDSDIYLLKVPFEIDNENVLSFSNATAQYNYFSSLPKLYLDNATYQRKDGVLRYPDVSDDLLTYNYCMYRNTAFSNKWFYAFIEDIKFVNTNMSEITLKTDVFETYQFDITYHKMFVEREHVNNDAVGKHTVPEGLETGEYICNKSQGVTYYDTSTATTSSNFSYASLNVVFGVTRDYTDFSIASGGEYGIYSGLKYYAFEITDISGINDFISDYATNGYLADIRCLFLAPKYIAPSNQSDYYAVPTHGLYTLNGRYTLKHDVDGYTPKNNKLYCSPYTYLLLDNHAGSCIKINLEDLQANYFATEGIDFDIIGTLGVGCSFMIYPTQYKNNVGINHGLTFAKLPTLSWAGDTYTNWLTQNSVNEQTKLETGVMGLGIGGALAVLTGGKLGAGFLGTGILNVLESITGNGKENPFIPASIQGNINAVDCLASDSRLNPTVYQMCVREEYAKIIDDFFSAYGYKVNAYKVPNITGRTNWNYVRTKNCNITGNIPQKDLQELKKIFDKGVTIWHNASTFLDYSQSNTIVS